jgi:hypothetical protein
MAVIVLDTDIAAATDAKLNQINAQAYRSALDNLKAHQLALIGNEQQTIALLQQQIARIPVDPSLREKLTLELSSKYMTTSTATVQATIDADSAADAARLKSAVNAVLATLA